MPNITGKPPTYKSPGRDWTPNRPLPDQRSERLANLLVTGLAKDGVTPLTRGESYLEAGYHCDPRYGAPSCNAKLKSRSNGLQARVDFLTDQVAKRMVGEVTAASKRRLMKTEARQDEFNDRLDWLWEQGSKLRPKLTAQGNAIKHPTTGEMIEEPASWVTCMKVAEMMGIDAGQLVRQSKSGKMGEEYSDLTTEKLRDQLGSQLAALGLQIVPLPVETKEPETEINSAEASGSMADSWDEPVNTDTKQKRESNPGLN